MKNKSDYILITVFAIILLCCIFFIIYCGINYKEENEVIEKSIVERQILEQKQRIEEICINVVNIYNQQLINYYLDPTEKNKEIVNKTAEAYNNYFKEKKRIWNGNVPEYIIQNLEIIE